MNLRFASVFLFLFLICLLLLFSLEIQALISAAIVSTLGAFLLGEFSITGTGKDSLSPKVWVGLLIFSLMYCWQAIRASADVALKVLKPKIKPGIVRIKTSLPKEWLITVLSNAITLTPGTLVVDVDKEKHHLYVHWIDVKEREPKAVAKAVFGPYEDFLKKL